jgi:hypothetical protein
MNKKKHDQTSIPHVVVIVRVLGPKGLDSSERFVIEECGPLKWLVRRLLFGKGLVTTHVTPRMGI